MSQKHLVGPVVVKEVRSYSRAEITIGKFGRSREKRVSSRKPSEFGLEITRDSNRGTDVSAKVGEYARAGIREYWILDRGNRKMLCYELQMRPSSYSQPVVHGKSKQVTSNYFGSFTFQELLYKLDAGEVVANTRVARILEIQSKRRDEESCARAR